MHECGKRRSIEGYSKGKGKQHLVGSLVDVDGKRKARCVGAFSDAVNFYEAEKVRVRKRIIAPIASHRGVRYKQLVEAALVYNEQSHRDQRNFAQRLEATLDQFGHRMATPSHPRKSQSGSPKWRTSESGRQRPSSLQGRNEQGVQTCIADGKVSRNPARLVPQRKESNGRVRFLSEQEEKRLRVASLVGQIAFRNLKWRFIPA